MTALTNETILSLIGSFYDEANRVSREGWQHVYTEMANIFSGGPGGIFLHNDRYDRFSLAVGNASHTLLDEYQDRYRLVSPFRARLKKLPVGGAFFRSDHMSDEMLLKTEFYNEFLRPQDVFEYAGFPLFNSRGTKAVLGLTRPRSRPRFSAAECKALTILHPHLRRAMEVYLSLTNATKENQTLETVLADSQQSIIVIDKDRQIVFLNESADGYLVNKDGLKIDQHGSLSLCSPAHDKRFNELLTGIFDHRIENTAVKGGVMQSVRENGLRPLQLRITPFSTLSLWGAGNDTLAIVYVYDPELHVLPQEAALIDLYGLTRSEAHIAVLLADGKSLEEIGDILGIKHNTAKTHLKHIFSKTDTHRQSELVKTLIKGVAVLASVQGFFI